MKTRYPVGMMPALLAACLIHCAQWASADQQVPAAISLATRAILTVNETGCNNAGGPRVTLAGTIALGDVTAHVTLSNNDKDTHSTTVTENLDFSLLLDDAITIPKQPVLGGVGGNPHIWIQFHDGNGNNLSAEIYLGRCVQGLKVSSDLVTAALALAEVGADGCSNHPGPVITLGGTITLSGLHARLIFRNNVKGTHVTTVVRDVTLIGEGTQIVVPKQPSQGGVGGNPLISVQFLGDNGAPLSEPVDLGRCNQL